MSLRVIFCLLLVLGFSWYAYRNWFVSLCASVVLMAFVKHPDMPRTVAGIPGFNMWNILIANVLIAWWLRRRQEVAPAETPRAFKIAVFLYFAVIFISFLRFFITPTEYYNATRKEIFLDFFVDSFRFLIPAFLLYEGTNSRERVRIALGSLVLLYFLLAVQVVRYVGIHPDFSGSELSGRAARIIEKNVGYDRVDMSMMLSGASWAALAFSNLMERWWLKWGVRGAAFVILFGQAMTGGRMGYVTWGVIGLALCVLKWRKLLPLIPLAAVIVVMFVPSVAQRMLAGFGGQKGGILVQEDESEITSGRSVVWPVVIAQIKKSPLIGYGRQGMTTTGTAAYVHDVLEDSFPHPHEAYLEMLLDAGIIGLACVLPIYLLCLKRSTGLFLDRTDIYYETAGAVGMALLLALLIASFGAQTLYPREGVVGMWAALGVALRLSVERQRQWEMGDDENEFAEVTVETDGMPYVDSGRETMAGV